MKFRTTQKAIRANYAKIICIGNADAQHLLSDLSPIAYTSGAYGWNADVYDLGNVAIVTGYRPFGNVKPRWSMVECLERAAISVLNSAYSSEQIKTHLAELRETLVESALTMA